jgi:hypothetical protein
MSSAKADRAIAVNADTGDVTVTAMTPAVIVSNIAAGLFGPLFVAPFVAIVDGSIINSVNGDKTPVLEGIKNGYKELFRHPIRYVRREWFICSLCWMVYAGTYAATNNARSYAEAHRFTAASSDALKFGVSLAVNVGLTQVKDILLVKEFARKGIQKAGGTTKVPHLSKFLFFCRDSLTMFAAFCVSDRLGSWLYERYSASYSKKTCLMGANFAVPAALQPVSTFFHLWALENAAALKEARSQKLADLREKFMPKYPISTASRVARIVPAVSVGNNVNIEVRRQLLLRFS